MEYYELNVCGLTRKLPIVRVSDELEIASFVLLGDTELVVEAAKEFEKLLPEIDVIITAEAKGIPLVHEVAKHLHMPHYVVARKSVKPYMNDPVVTEVFSVTTQKKQILCLDSQECDYIRGKRVAIMDDVISTGESLKAIENLVKKAGGNVVAKAAILAEGDAKDRKDIIYLQELPIFKVKPSR